MKNKKVLTLQDIKEAAKDKKSIKAAVIGLAIMVYFFGMMTLNIFTGAMEYKSKLKYPFGCICAFVAIVCLFTIFKLVAEKKPLPKDDNWKIQIESRTVLGKYSLFVNEDDGPTYKYYIIIEPGILLSDNSYLCKEYEYADIYTGDKVYIVNAEDAILYYFERQVELDEQLNQYFIESSASSDEKRDEVVRSGARIFLASSSYLACRKCNRLVNFHKYKNECKYCNQSMGYSEEEVMEMIRKGMEKTE